MIRLTKEKVLQLHRLMAEETGGTVGLRDEGLLESALAGAFGGFGGMDFYPTAEEKAARLGYSLIRNHAFLDGNKRIGMFVMLTFLEVNGIHPDCTVRDVAQVGWAVGDGSMDYWALLSWIREHS